MAVNESTDDVVPATYVPLARPVVADVASDPVAAEPMRLLDSSPAQAGWDVFALLIVAVGIELVMGTVARTAASAVSDADPRVLNIILTLARGAILLLVIGVILRSRRQTPASVGLCVERWWVTGLLGLGAAAAAYAAQFASMGGFYLVYPAGLEAMRENSQRIIEEVPKLHPVVLCSIAMFVGVYEEIIFRGFILTRLRRATGSAVSAVVFSAILFAAPHVMTQEAIVMVPIFLLGIIWAVLTLWRRSVVAAIIGHALFDASQLIGMYLFFPDWT